MTDHLIHNRVFKVSKELNRLDMLCEQHRRHISHRQGLPDWERPMTPAGKANSSHERTPAFFAWNEDPAKRSRPTWETETPQKVARTLHLSPARDRQPLPERSPDPETATIHRNSNHVDNGSALKLNVDVNSVEANKLLSTERSIAISPIQEDILDRTSSPVRALSVERAPPSQLRPQHRIPSVTATPTSRMRAAGLLTEQADHYRMNRSSGKRIRSPAQTSLWENGNDTFNPLETVCGRDASSLSHKRIPRSTAERTFDSSAVSQALNMTPIRSQSTRQERQSICTGAEALNVATRATQEFGPDEEWKQTEPPQFETIIHPDDRVHRGRIIESPQTSKRVSFNGETARSQPRTLPVLADKTTQTDESLWPLRPGTIVLPSNVYSQDLDASVRCSECKSLVDESGRPHKVPRHSVAAPQSNYRRSSSHLTNPIFVNPRYPPEPATFRKRSTTSSVFNDRLAWR